MKMILILVMIILPFEQGSKTTGEKELLSCSLGLKIFGNELSYFECQNWSQLAKYYSLDLADTAIKFLKVGLLFLPFLYNMNHSILKNLVYPRSNNNAVNFIIFPLTSSRVRLWSLKKATSC